MLTEDGTAKLLDFGLAKLTDNLSGAVPVAPRPPIQPGCAARPAPPKSESRLVAETLAAPSTPAWQAAIVAPPAGRPAGPGRGARLNDLGHARTLREEKSARGLPELRPAGTSLTAAGSILGTPAYMAPEVWRGEAATRRSDVYSLGALLYELSAGYPPHREEMMEELALAALDSDARPLAELAVGVDQRFAAIIDHCLHRDPAARFASGEELQHELEALAAQVAIPTARTILRSALRTGWPVAVAIASVLLLLPAAALYYFYQVGQEQRSTETLMRNRRSIAVLGLRAISSAQQAGFAAAFSELLGDELAIGERLRRVPAESVARMKRDLNLAEAESHAPEALLRIRHYLGVDLVITGSYQVDPVRANLVCIRIRVQDTQSGARLAAADVSGSVSRLFELLSHTGRELREQLGGGRLSSAQTLELRAARPTSPEVAQLYAQGREKLRRFDAVGARSLLSRAISADPDYPLAHLAMSDVWTALGYDEKARQEAQRAFELSGNLAREDRALVEARYREAAKDWDRAIALYRSLLTFFPESLDHGLALVGAQLSAGQPEAARQSAEKLRQLPSPASADPRLDILAAKAAAGSGDRQAAQALLARAARKGEALGAPLLVARARLEEAYTLDLMGQHERALHSASAARPVFAADGDRGATADALMAMSTVYVHQGDIARSLAAVQDAHRLLLSIENSALTAANLCNMAFLLIKLGDLKLALARAEGGMLLAREIGALESMGSGLIAMGSISLLQGDTGSAIQSFRQAEDAFKSLGDSGLVAWAYWNIAQVYLVRGELELARRKHEEALLIRDQGSLKGFAAESRAALAEVALEEHEPARAESLARIAVQQFAQQSQVESEAWAQALLAAALHAQGRQAEAIKAIDQARRLAQHCQNLSIGLLVRRLFATLRVEPGQKKSLDAAQRELTAILGAASAAGFVIEELQTRLAIYRISLKQDNGNEVAEKLSVFSRGAARRGFGLIARNALANTPSK